MTDLFLDEIDEVLTINDTDLLHVETDPSGTPEDVYIQWGNLKALVGGGGGSNSICDGRLTLETGVPISTTDQTAKTTVYFTPYIGNKIALYDGSADWDVIEFTEKSVSVPATTSTPFDIFGYNNSGTLALETVNWTNDTTRATALVYQDGVLVKSGATTRRYLGTGRTTTVNGQCEDSVTNRLIWNMYNRVPRGLSTCPGYNNDAAATSYSINSTTYVEANGGTGSKVRFVLGRASQIDFLAAGRFAAASGGVASMAIGIDTITNPVRSTTANITTLNTYFVSENNKGLTLAEGGHYASLLFFYATAGPFTVFADNGNRGGASTDPETTYLTGRILG